MLEDLIPLITRDDFSKIEVLSPDNLNIDKKQAERLLSRISKEYNSKVKEVYKDS